MAMYIIWGKWKEDSIRVKHVRLQAFKAAWEQDDIGKGMQISPISKR